MRSFTFIIAARDPLGCLKPLSRHYVTSSDRATAVRAAMFYASTRAGFVEVANLRETLAGERITTAVESPDTLEA